MEFPMNDTLNAIHDVDLAVLAFEKSRANIEAAKAALENAKQESEAARVRLEDALCRAEEAGLPRAKVRKVAEERANALLVSGLLRDEATPAEKIPPKTPKAPRRAKSVEAEVKPKSEIEWADDKAPVEILAEVSA
jgi:hypothetical protein